MHHWQAVMTTLAAAMAGGALLLAPSSVAGAPLQLVVHETPAPPLVPGVTETRTIVVTDTGAGRLYDLALRAGPCSGPLCRDVEVAVSVGGHCVLGGPSCQPSPAVTLDTMAGTQTELAATLPPGGQAHLVVRERLSTAAPSGRTAHEAWGYSGSQ